MRRYAKFVLALFLLGLVPLMSGAGAVGRSFVAGRFALELDGVVVGWLQSVEGGNAVSEVVEEQLGPDHAVKKHIAGVKYEDITVTFGVGMSPALYDWIKHSFDGSPTRKNGAIIAADYNHREMGRLTFANALITEIGMPALDASSKDAAKMTLKFRPELTRRAEGSGMILKVPGAGVKQKMWLPSNFRLRIDGLDSAMSRVNKIEAITIKQKLVENAVGDGRDYELEPAKLEFPNLVFSTTDSGGQALYDWQDDFMILGNNGEAQEKSGTLEYLTPDLKDVLFRVTFDHLGIFHLTPDKLEAGSEQLRRVKAEMYCEGMRFDFTPAATN